MVSGNTAQSYSRYTQSNGSRHNCSMSRGAHDDFLTWPGGRNASKRESAEDKDTKYIGRWTSCKLLPHGFMGRNFPPVGAASVQRMYTQLYKERLGGTISTAVFPIVAADRATRLHQIQRERAYARHTVVLQETLECAGNGDRAVHLRLPTGEACPAPRIQSDLYDRFGTAAAHGFPDLDPLTMGKMVENVRTLARSVDISVICDADTGYDEAINVQRTVREYEDRREAIWPK
jgi:hypothetical protein